MDSGELVLNTSAVEGTPDRRIQRRGLTRTGTKTGCISPPP